MSEPLSNEPFLTRTTLAGFLPEGYRPRNYLVLILMVAFMLPFMTRGARLALNSINNEISAWLPSTYPESAELRRFQQHFAGEQFALVSWEGCTLGDTKKLELLARKLVPSEEDRAVAEKNKSLAEASGQATEEEQRLFKKVVTGPAVLERLTSPPLNLDYHEAILRLEGSLVGPVPKDALGTDHEDAARTTCMIVTLSAYGQQDNKHKKEAIETIRRIAKEECQIDNLHMGGPPVDNVEIDKEGERSLVRLAGLSGIVGFVLSYLSFRSVKLTLMVFFTGVVSAGVSLAIVYYFGMIEVFVMGLDRPNLGAVDAILMSMPSVVYVLGLSGAIHIVNYFKDARQEKGLRGAAEEAVRHGWLPCTLAAITTSVGLGSLFISDIMPIKRFGLFTGIGVLATLMLLFSLLPALLFRFPPKEQEKKPSEKPQGSWLENIAMGMGHFVTGHHGVISVVCLIFMCAAGYGLTMIETRIQLLKLFASDADIIKDYAWLEDHLGNLVPMEVVVKVAPSRIRQGDEDAEENGQLYRMTMLERMRLVRRLQEQIEGRWQNFDGDIRRIGGLEHVGRTLTAVTFGPNLDPEKNTATRTVAFNPEYVINEMLEKNREEIIAEGEYLRNEIPPKGKPETGREFWRISARVAALDDVDYGVFVHDIREKVEPVLNVYRERDVVLQKLHEAGKSLRRTKILVVYDSPQEIAEIEKPDEGEFVPEPLIEGAMLKDLLKEGYASVDTFNLAKYKDKIDDESFRASAANQVGKYELVVVADRNQPLNQDDLLSKAPLVVKTSELPKLEHAEDAAKAEGTSDSSSIDGVIAAYTGIVPLVYRTQARLMVSLEESSVMSFVLIAIVMSMVLRSPLAGTAAMAPNVFPIVVVFGIMGWIGVKIDIGIMMTASVALGVAVDDTIHFLTWFSDGIKQGMTNRDATLHAYQRCAAAMFQTTLIGGLGLAVFAASTFTPTQQFGVLMVCLLSAALVGDLIFLPAMLCGPFGRFFRGKVKHTDTPPDDQPPAAKTEELTATVRPGVRRDTSHSSMVRMLAYLFRPFLT